MRRRAEPLIAPELAPAYRRFVAGGFRRGLQSVARNRDLKRLAGGSALPRELDAHQWAELFLARREYVQNTYSRRTAQRRG